MVPTKISSCFATDASVLVIFGPYNSRLVSIGVAHSF